MSSAKEDKAKRVTHFLLTMSQIVKFVKTMANCSYANHCDPQFMFSTLHIRLRTCPRNVIPIFKGFCALLDTIFLIFRPKYSSSEQILELVDVACHDDKLQLHKRMLGLTVSVF